MARPHILMLSCCLRCPSVSSGPGWDTHAGQDHLILLIILIIIVQNCVCGAA